jgi:hypothetical protein
MYLDARYKTRALGNDSRKQFPFVPVKPMRGTMKNLRPDTRVAKKNLKTIPRRRIPCLGRPDIVRRIFKKCHTISFKTAPIIPVRIATLLLYPQSHIKLYNISLYFTKNNWISRHLSRPLQLTPFPPIGASAVAAANLRPVSENSFRYPAGQSAQE